MSALVLRFLAYFGPRKEPAALEFAPGLNVICGASDTGKSFIAETIDFMLGQEAPVRDIPERDGYDKIRLVIECPESPTLTLDRSVEGGNFLSYEKFLKFESDDDEPSALRYKHSATRQDTLSYALLSRIGLDSKVLRKNASGVTRSLSFRDMARLCVVTEEEIQGRGSPLLSGQYTSATAEYAAFKLLLTGVDDSALVGTKEQSTRRENDSAKIDLLNEMIEDLQHELDEQGIEEAELLEQLEQLNASIENRNESLSQAQEIFNELIQRRGAVASSIEEKEGRITEVSELIARFHLLDDHYESDLKRLQAIRATGSLFVHIEQKQCPLCGAAPDAQHLESDCDGNAEAVVQAAEAEIAKIERLRRELSVTVSSLEWEMTELQQSLPDLVQKYEEYSKEINEIVSPAVVEERSSYNALISASADIRIGLSKIERLKGLIHQRDEIEGRSGEEGEGAVATKTQVSKNILDEYSQTVEAILKEWHYPNAGRVFFDESKRDFQIGGKERGSSGKGLRAITHAAVKIGLMEFCIERGLPHPGFVVLDSPLLAYWKPEGKGDDLSGTDLKEKFYEYLSGLSDKCQVIVIENEHPPASIEQSEKVTIFTKNPQQGRYGFFPVS